MDFKEQQKKRSPGALRIAEKTKDRSPDMTGQLKLRRHTATAILEGFSPGCDEVICNIAGWRNQDASGPYLTVAISARYVAREYRPSTKGALDFIFKGQESDN
jgi:hypothetical protein